MRSVVVVPCYQRPEFLAATLTRLRRARGFKEHAFLFSLDRDYDPEIPGVIATLFPIEHVYYRVARRQHNYRGAAYSILESLRDALTMKPDLVYLVEDDVWVADDFFEFHEAAHDLDADAFTVSAGRNSNLGRSFSKTREIDHTLANRLADSVKLDAIYRHTSYQSIGTSHKAEFLPEVLEHANRAYYEHPVDYCTRILDDPDLPMEACSPTELIHRIARRRVWWSVYPFVPRAFEVRPKTDQLFETYVARQRGTWQSRAEALLNLSTSELVAYDDETKPCELTRGRSIDLCLTEIPRSSEPAPLASMSRRL